MRKGQIFSVVAALALVWGLGGASVRAEQWCGDIEKLQSEARSGKLRAQMDLASCYFAGVGVPKDERRALEWSRKAAEQGYAPAYASLGNAYTFGSGGMPEDEHLADQWYRKAAKGLPALAEQGDSLAQSVLGNMYSRGVGGLPKDEQLAAQWTRKAAEQGEVIAQFSLGYMYRSGKGVTKDVREGMAWLRKAADQGFVSAQFQLGQIYEHGQDGVPQDFDEAAAWYRKAADRGYDVAQSSLGLLELKTGAKRSTTARNDIWLQELKKPCLNKCLADSNTCKAGCMGVTDSDGSSNKPSSRETCNDLCADALKACNNSCG